MKTIEDAARALIAAADASRQTHVTVPAKEWRDLVGALCKPESALAQRLHDFADDLQVIAARGHRLDVEILAAAQELHGIGDAIEQDEADALETQA